MNKQTDYYGDIIMKISELEGHFLKVSDEDVIEAMKEISGYIDITPKDFIELYQVAFQHAFERLKSAIKAEHIMTTSVVTIDEDWFLTDAAKLMADHAVSGLPVLDAQGKVYGMISEKDFLKHMTPQEQPSFMQAILNCLEQPGQCLANDFKRLRVKEIMSSPPITVEMGTPVLKVADILESNRINRVPVLDQQSNLTGIIARSDLVRALS
jgi:CBS-domain-containing membrane protein